MSVDIGALLAGFADEQERVALASAPDPVSEVLLLAARVRARRLRRAGTVVVATIAAVLLGSAVAYGLSHDATPGADGLSPGVVRVLCVTSAPLWEGARSVG